MRAYRAKRSADAKQKEASYKRAYEAKKTLKKRKSLLVSKLCHETIQNKQ